MSRISVDGANAEDHRRRILDVANEYSSANSSFLSPARKTTLSAIENGAESFDDSNRLLMDLASLSRDSAINIGRIVGNVISIDQQQAANFESSGGATL